MQRLTKHLVKAAVLWYASYMRNAVICNDASILANSDAEAVCAIYASTALNEFRMR